MPFRGFGAPESQGRGDPLQKKAFLTRILLVFLFQSLFLSCPTWAPAATESGVDKKEEALGRKVCEQVEKRWVRVTDPIPVARLETIQQKLIPLVERPLPYEVRVISEDRPNAFSLPGGFVYFTSGMLDFAKSDSELASIMAHEMVHADKKHGMIQSARNERLSLLALAVAIASRGEAAAVIMANIAQVAILNSYSRDLEREADLEALKMLNSAEYPVSSAITVMERLSEERLKHPYFDPGVFMDHPDIPERLDYMTKAIREAGWPLHRKEPLHLLKVAIVQDGNRLSLAVDGKPAWGGPAAPETRSCLEGAGRVLDRYLQMELLPNDIAVRKDHGGSSLRVGPGLVVREKDLAPGMGSLESFAEALRKALVEAQRTHPMGHYLL